MAGQAFDQGKKDSELFALFNSEKYTNKKQMQKPAEQNQIWVYASDQIQKITDIKYPGIVMMRMVLAWGMWTPLMTEDPTWGDPPHSLL